MVREKFYFLSKDSKTKIHAVRFIPDDGVINGVIQLVHGMEEHIGRYGEFAEYLTGHGFLVIGHDHLGHGLSVRSKNKLGYFCKPNPSAVLVEDMHQVTMIAKNEYPDLPYFILGHSMGSYLLRRYLTCYSGDVDGAILCGTGSVPSVVCYTGVAVCAVIATFRGWHYRSSFMKKISLGGEAYTRFMNDPNDPTHSWLSKNMENVMQYLTDPLCDNDFTLNGYYGLLTTIAYDNKEEHVRQTRSDLPIFIVAGADDPVGEFGDGVKRVYRQYKKVGLEDVTMKLYPEDRHEIINELDREDVYADIWGWIQSKLDRE